MVNKSGDALRPLSEEECLQLLASHGIGRIGTSVRALPAVFPVNYVLHQGQIVFRISPGSELAEATRDAVVAFEIDGADTLAHEGWSVLVVGRASQDAPTDAQDEQHRIRLTPWAGGDRDVFVRVPLDLISGRRISRSGSFDPMPL